MTKKEEFLRAVQQVKSLAAAEDAALIFRWALNLNEKAIPVDVQIAARDFVRELTRKAHK